MNDIYSIQYESKGNKEFILPFRFNKETEVVVWIGNTLQDDINYNIEVDEENSFNKKYSSNEAPQVFGKVVFFEPIGSPNKPEIVTLEKKTSIERITDFKDYTVFRADNLNFELDNFVDMIKSLETIIQNSILKSKLEDKKNVIIFPKSQEGKGIYWGKNGELLNTKNNIDNLNAENIYLKTKEANIKNNNLQEYIYYIDSNITELKSKYIILEKLLTDFKESFSKNNIKGD